MSLCEKYPTILSLWLVSVMLNSCTSPHPVLEHIYNQCKIDLAQIDPNNRNNFSNSTCAQEISREISTYESSKLVSFPDHPAKKLPLSNEQLLRYSQDLVQHLDTYPDKYYVEDGLISVSGPVMLAVFSEMYPSTFYKQHCQLDEGQWILCNGRIYPDPDDNLKRFRLELKNATLTH